MATTPIREHYETNGPQEWRRLVKDPFHRVELDTTLHFLERHLPPSGRLLDAGGGPSRYTIALARRGYEVVLLDLTPGLLDIARRQIARAGLKRRVPFVLEWSVVDLGRFPGGYFHAVIWLGGDISHVASEEERQQAVRELVRIAKPGAPVAISVNGRLAVLAESPRYWPAWIEHAERFRATWQDGDDHHWCGSPMPTSSCRRNSWRSVKRTAWRSWRPLDWKGWVPTTWRRSVAWHGGSPWVSRTGWRCTPPSAPIPPSSPPASTCS